MADRLELALSPYLLSTRETPAVVAMLLGDRVVTLLPSAGAGESRAAVRSLVDAAPSYLRLLESWRWSGALWRAGVVARGSDGTASQDALVPTYRRIDEEEWLSDLRRWTRHAQELRRSDARSADSGRSPRAGALESPIPAPAQEDGAQFLQALCADVLKGGPDPGFNIPIGAALDAFASRHGLICVRSSVDSLAQRAESRIARRLFTIGLPVLTRASGGTIMKMRDAMNAELRCLRSALVQALRGHADADSHTDAANAPAKETAPARGERSRARGDESPLAAACEAYARAFERWSSEHIPGDDEFGERLVVGYCSLTAVRLPVDSMLRCGQAAMTAAGSPAAQQVVRPLGGPGAQGDPSGSTERGSGRASEWVCALIVKELNVRPEAASGAHAGRQSGAAVGSASGKAAAARPARDLA